MTTPGQNSGRLKNMKITLVVALLALSEGLGVAQDRTAKAGAAVVVREMTKDGKSMLSRGIVEEESKQNLDGAIQAYQAVLAQFDEERKIAATALFRLAECYRKLGKNDQAIAAYRRVTQEFRDQSKLVEQSRNHLTKTFKLRPDQSASAEVQEARRRYRGILEAEVKATETAVKIEERKYQLGTSTTLDLEKVKLQLLQVQRALAAFDAGLVGSASPPQR